jgi:protein involved in polysaccharide export with SLBB domain
VDATIEIVVAGAVERVGRLRLEAGATLRVAIEAAGGLAYRPGARPEGALLLRRRGPTSRQALMQRWDIFRDDPRAWQSARLEHRDVVVVAWTLSER